MSEHEPEECQHTGVEYRADVDAVWCSNCGAIKEPALGDWILPALPRHGDYWEDEAKAAQAERGALKQENDTLHTLAGEMATAGELLAAFVNGEKAVSGSLNDFFLYGHQLARSYRAVLVRWHTFTEKKL